MKRTVDYYIASLVDYAIEKGLSTKEDRVYLINGILGVLDLHEYKEPETTSDAPSLEEILGALLDYAAESGIMAEDSIVLRDLFDTKLMGVLTPRPSEVINKFFEFYKSSPEAATDYFYKLCLDSDYIREYRIKKDLKWRN